MLIFDLFTSVAAGNEDLRLRTGSVELEKDAKGAKILLSFCFVKMQSTGKNNFD